MQADRQTGVLVLAGAPLGNPADASPRLREALSEADVVAAEDTRRLARLAADLGVRPLGKVVSYFDANEAARTPELIEELRAGRRVVLVTDAGMPSISDPGFRLVAQAVAEGFEVTCVPGPSAVTTALALSGLPVNRFCFEGFLPRKAGERRSRLAALADEPRTLVFFEAPHRAAATLAAMAEAFGPARRAAACREMTKTYEEVRRGTLAELREWADGGLRGELTLVVAGRAPASAVAGTAVAGTALAESAPAGSALTASAQAAPDGPTLVGLVAAAEAAGLTRKEAMVAVGKATGVGRRAVFEALVADKRR